MFGQGAEGNGEEGPVVTAKGCEVSFWGDENVLVEVVVAQYCEYTKYQ